MSCLPFVQWTLRHKGYGSVVRRDRHWIPIRRLASLDGARTGVIKACFRCKSLKLTVLYKASSPRLTN